MLENVIACPNPDHGSLQLEHGSYVCTVCGARFEVRNGIPVLLPTQDAHHG